MIEVTPTLTLDVRPVSTKEYNIITLRGSKQKESILHTDDKPITKYGKTNSGGKVLKYLDKKLSESIVKNIMQDDSSYEIGTTISEYKEDYIQNILSELEKIRQRVCGNVKEETEAKYDETILIKDLRLLIKMGKKYPNLWQDFQARCKSLQYTPLEFISKVTDGLGVGLTVEVIRAFFGYLQTYLGYKGTNVIAIGNQSSGKAGALDERIPTPKGWTTFGNIQVGDELFDENGEITTVIAKSPIWDNQECYTITFDNNEKVTVNGNHLWLVNRKEDSDVRIFKSKHEGYSKGFRWNYTYYDENKHLKRISAINEEELKKKVLSKNLRWITDELKPITLTTKEMFKSFKIGKGSRVLNNYSIDSTKPLDLPKQELLIDPYVLGCWLGDGSSHGQYITNTDSEIIDEINKKYSIKKIKKKYTYGIYDGFSNLLKEYDLINNKHIPPIYLRGSYEQRLNLIQGLMDTDGYISKDGYCEITLKNYELISGLKELLSTFGIKSHINIVEKCAANTVNKIKRKYYRIHFCTNLEVFKLPRKKQRLPSTISKSNSQRIITNIEKVESVPTQCIQVSNSSSLFLCEDFIPTHNSHIIETALKFMPQEYVHMGVKSVAYFFRKYNHQDLTGHIFYLGDLGGDNDNEDTIRMRDILKQLSTDGYIERGVVDDEKNSEEQWVKGYPCLTYTTAHEGMINEQERSRSIIITPPDVTPDKLLTFKSILNNQGAYKYELLKVQRDCESIKGLVEYLKNVKKEVDIFNPFLYDIGDFIGDIEDFNRKVDEFNSILKLSCILNKSKVIMHQQYDTESPLILASKQDVRNALAIFDNTVNLLPNEVKLINGILKNFESFPISNDFSSVAEYEDYIKNSVGTLEGSNIPDWLSENNDECSIFFNERYLRSKCGNQRWVRTNSSDLHQKLDKLYQQEYLIKIGYNSKDDPVYAINGLKYKDAQKVNYVSPSFKSQNLKKSCELFHENYPCSVEEYKEFVENLPPVKSSDEVFFEELSKEAPIYNLGWLT